MHLALAALDPVWEDREANLPRARELVRRAAARGARLVAFPEMTLTGFTLNATSIAEPPAASPTIEWFAECAREHAIAIAFGVVLHGRDRPTNSLVLLDRRGEEVARYAKLHLFSPGGEADHYERGDDAPVAVVEDVAFGLSICYDLRFPEYCAALAPAVQALLVIASWPQVRIAHWFALLQARAIECQCWVAAVNRTGVDGHGQQHPPSSCLFDPLGVLVEPEWREDELQGYTLDPERTQAQRRAFPVRRDRLPDLYARIARPEP